MAKFKKGDRVRCIVGTTGRLEQIHKGYQGVVDESHSNMPYVVWDNPEANRMEAGKACICSDQIELITPSDTYTKLTTKVGDRFRVVKEYEGCPSLEKGDIITNTGVTPRNLYEWKVEGSDEKTGAYDTILTTEYLEPVEEKSCGAEAPTTKEEWEEIIGGPEPTIKTTKQSIMNKLTSALKKALSPDLQALYKTGIINGGLELSSAGREAYTNAMFSNGGDHKAAVAEMVEATKEEIEEAKG